MSDAERPQDNGDGGALTDEAVRKIARLSRLAVPDEAIPEHARRLEAVLGYMERLGQVDTQGVEPLAHAGESGNRLDEDTPGATLKNEDLMRIAPATEPPFIKVPKVLGDGGGA